MTTQYQNEVRSACEELCLALERFSIGGRETLESMAGLRLNRLKAVCEARLSGEPLMCAVHDLWKTQEEDRMLREQLRQVELFKRSMTGEDAHSARTGKFQEAGK